MAPRGAVTVFVPEYWYNMTEFDREIGSSIRVIRRPVSDSSPRTTGKTTTRGCKRHGTIELRRLARRPVFSRVSWTGVRKGELRSVVSSDGSAATPLKKAAMQENKVWARVPCLVEDLGRRAGRLAIIQGMFL